MSTASVPSQSESVLSPPFPEEERLADEVRSQPLAQRLQGKRVAMVVFSEYPSDPRPRRAVEALLQEGMSVDLLCEGNGHSQFHETSGSLNITRIPIRHFRGGFLSYAYQYFAFILFSSLILIWRTIWRRYDLVYVHNMPDVLVACAIVPKAFGAKVILDQHDPMPELMMTIFHREDSSKAVRLLYRLEKWSIRRAHRVITVNEACRKLFTSRGCPDEKIRVVMNAPDEKLFSYRGADTYAKKRDGEFVIMYHGSLVERNGLDLVVTALAKLLEIGTKVQLRVYGRATPYLERVLSRAKGLGITENVHFLGSRSLEQLDDEIQRCDLGVIPNQRNRFTDINTPTRVFEYLAKGKPVVAPRTPGILDYFGPDELFYFTAGDADSMVVAIRRVINDRGEGVANAERGQQVYQRHTWSQEREVLVKSVCELLS